MHVILYVLDSLRPDHLGCYGYGRDTSPCLDALTRDAVLFENGFTSSTWTRPVAASLLTGTYPGVHLTRSRHDTFSTNLPRLPEVLREAGYRTAGFATIGHLDSTIGFGRGFDRYDDLFRMPEILARRGALDASHEGLMDQADGAVALPRAEDVNERLFPWLEENRARDAFSFVWTIDPHVPFSPPEGFRRFSSPSSERSGAGSYADERSASEKDRQRLVDLYDDEIGYADHQIGAFVEHLQRLDIYDETLLVVTGDHGESFYEHGLYGHGHTPFDEVIRVPLIVKLPGGAHGGRRSPHFVELVDLFDTVLDCTGLSLKAGSESASQGHSVLPLLEEGAEPARRCVFSETQSLGIHNRYLSVRTERWKYIAIERPERSAGTLAGVLRHVLQRRMVWDIVRAPRHFFKSYFQRDDAYLFDLTTDPQERLNLYASRPDQVVELEGVLQDWLAENATRAELYSGSAYAYEESEAMKRHLESLHYE